METRFLKTFLRVVEMNSIASAARVENLTPSAVVQRLRALEAELGQPLVSRVGHSMRATEAGLSVLDAAKRMVELSSGMASLASQKENVGTIRVGVIHSMITGLLPEILSSMKESCPRIAVELIPGQSSDLFQRVKEGSLDGAVMVEPPFSIPKEYLWYELRKDPLIVLTKGNEGTDDPYSLLKTEPFIRYDRKHWGGRAGNSYLKRHQINPNDRYELDSLEAIAVLVDRGFGISLVPDWFPPWPEKLLLRKLVLQDAPYRSLGVFFARTATTQRLMTAFADEARKASTLKEMTLAGEEKLSPP